MPTDATHSASTSPGDTADTGEHLFVDRDLGPDIDITEAGTRPAVRIPYAPGLDGLRGLAVAAVLVFHAGPPTWLPGGYLGVSLFFTLSGYLITSLVITEIGRDRRVDLAAFWARRMRRLVPALVVTSLAVVAMSLLVDLRRGVRADLIGGLTYSANWVQVAKGESYGNLFLAPSPLVHLWSLAIEEQFYVVLPVAAWVISRAGRGRARSRLATGAALVIAAGTLATFATTDPTVGYYSTLDRAPEIAIGVLVACLTHVSTRRAPGWMTAAGFVALALAAWATATVAVTDEIVTSGGLLVFALLSAAMVRTAARPGPFATVLSFAPLRWLGLISYGLYLYHWPVVVLIDERRTDLEPGALFVARVVVSLVVALTSYALIEQPLRHGKPDIPSLRVVLAGVAALVATLALVLVVVPPDADDAPAPQPAPAVVDLADVDKADATDPDGTPAEDQAATPAGPPVVAMLGDSVPAWMIRDGGSGLDPDEVAMLNGTLPACDGAEGTPEARSATGALVPIPEGCTGWRTQYPPFFAAGATDVAVLMLGGHAGLDREIDGRFRSPCDPVNADWYRRDLRARIRFLQFRADKVVVVLPAWPDELSAWIYPDDAAERMECVRDVLRDATADAEVSIVDFADYVCPGGPTGCRGIRERDGMHIDPAAAPAALGWLVDQILVAR